MAPTVIPTNGETTEAQARREALEKSVQFTKAIREGCWRCGKTDGPTTKYHGLEYCTNPCLGEEMRRDELVAWFDQTSHSQGYKGRMC